MLKKRCLLGRVFVIGLFFGYLEAPDDECFSDFGDRRIDYDDAFLFGDKQPVPKKQKLASSAGEKNWGSVEDIVLDGVFSTDSVESNLTQGLSSDEDSPMSGSGVDEFYFARSKSFCGIPNPSPLLGLAAFSSEKSSKEPVIQKPAYQDKKLELLWGDHKQTLKIMCDFLFGLRTERLNDLGDFNINQQAFCSKASLAVASMLKRDLFNFLFENIFSTDSSFLWSLQCHVEQGPYRAPKQQHWSVLFHILAMCFCVRAEESFAIASTIVHTCK